MGGYIRILSRTLFAERISAVLSLASRKRETLWISTFRSLEYSLDGTPIAVTQPDNLSGQSDGYSNGGAHDNHEGSVPGSATPNVHSWEDASEMMIRDIIQCLTKDNDTELSTITCPEASTSMVRTAAETDQSM